MKAAFLLLFVGGVVVAALYLPLDRTRGVAKNVARMTAHELRVAWDWVTAPQPAASKTPPARKAAARRVSREGIVAQPPKEKLSPDDKAALDKLIRH